MTQGKLAVTASDLRAVSTKVESMADAAARDVDEFDGQQSVRSGEAAGFDTMSEARSCEQSWQQAVEVIGAKLAAAADKLNLNADAYVATEQGIAQQFGH